MALLREQKDYVSGQELCQRFGVSRTAVWKAIGQLKKEGYAIDAVQNRGYRLADMESIYGQNELSSRIKSQWAGHRLHYFDSLGSTNAQAKLEAEAGAAHGTLVVTDMQTAGRGRRGRDWSSPAGTNVYFTLILRPDCEPNQASMLTLVMALAVAKGIARVTGLQADIKWPNDIVVNGKKVCGILTEMSLEQDYIQYLVTGVGINVRQQDFAPDIVNKATALEMEGAGNVNRAELIAAIMKAYEEDYQVFQATGSLAKLRDTYDSMLVNRGRKVVILDPKGDYEGIARGIDDAGQLLVELPSGEIVKVYAGEVSVRGTYGYV